MLRTISPAGVARLTGSLWLVLLPTLGACASGGAGGASGPSAGGTLRASPPDSDAAPQAVRASRASTMADAVARLETGERVRLFLPGERRLSGPVLYRSSEVVELRDGMRQRRVLVEAVQRLQIRREGRSWGLPLGIAGAVAGGVAFAVTDLGIGGTKEKQGDALNPFLGAVAGSLAGAAIGSLFGGDSWETVAERGR